MNLSREIPRVHQHPDELATCLGRLKNHGTTHRVYSDASGLFIVKRRRAAAAADRPTLEILSRLCHPYISNLRRVFEPADGSQYLHLDLHEYTLEEYVECQRVCEAELLSIAQPVRASLDRISDRAHCPEALSPGCVDALCLHVILCSSISC